MRAVGVFHFDSIALHGFDIWKWAIAWALVFILVALREEFRARGYGLFTLSAGIGFWPAAILSAACFGYSHHGNSGEDWIGLFNAGAFGLLACFLLRRTGNLWMPIGLHMAFDWGETYFYGVANSGQTLPGHLLNSSSSGPPWLSGGTVGPEGSAALHFADCCGVVDLRGSTAGGQISQARPNPGFPLHPLTISFVHFSGRKLHPQSFHPNGLKGEVIQQGKSSRQSGSYRVVARI